MSSLAAALNSLTLALTQLSALITGMQCEPITITGYFTPYEIDYVGTQVRIQTIDNQSFSVSEAFMADFNIEHMGRLASLNYIGQWDTDNDGDPEFYTLDCPLDAQGHCLRAYDAQNPSQPGSAASNDYPLGTRFHLGGPAGPFYEVTDTIGVDRYAAEQSVDLYMGEGAEAKAKTSEITRLSDSGIICLTTPQ